MNLIFLFESYIYCCIGSALQYQLNHSINKVGLCVICSCTNPKHGEDIVGCTAPDKMSKCFGNDLGYLASVDRVTRVKSHVIRVHKTPQNSARMTHHGFKITSNSLEANT